MPTEQALLIVVGVVRVIVGVEHTHPLVVRDLQLPCFGQGQVPISVLVHSKHVKCRYSLCRGLIFHWEKETAHLRMSPASKTLVSFILT